MRISFQKMHGTLNDFVVFHDFDRSVSLSPAQVSFLCDRRAGIGADGVIVVRESADADFFMDYVNADGSLAEMCGNGIRCLAKYVYDSRLITHTTLRVETGSGVKVLELELDSDGLVQRVRVDMGTPIFNPAMIPALLVGQAGPVIDYPIEAEGRSFQATILSMGNPHCVIFLDEDVEPLPKPFGPALEHHGLFPARTNVEFVRAMSRDRLLMRVWERGSGETFSCGTGACAVAVAASLKGLIRERVTVELLGGDLEIEWKGYGSPVLMTGPVASIYAGFITI